MTTRSFGSGSDGLSAKRGSVPGACCACCSAATWAAAPAARPPKPKPVVAMVSDVLAGAQHLRVVQRSRSSSVYRRSLQEASNLGSTHEDLTQDAPTTHDDHAHVQHKAHLRVDGVISTHRPRYALTKDIRSLHLDARRSVKTMFVDQFVAILTLGNMLNWTGLFGGSDVKHGHAVGRA